MAHAGRFGRRVTAELIHEAAVEMCEDAQQRRKAKPPFEALESCLEDLLAEVKHVRLDVLGLKGDFIDSDVVYSSEEEDDAVPDKIKRRMKAKKRKPSQSESEVNSFSKILLQTLADNQDYL